MELIVTRGIGVLRTLVFAGRTPTEMDPSKVEGAVILLGNFLLAFLSANAIFCLVGVRLSLTKKPLGFALRAASSIVRFWLRRTNLAMMLRRSSTPLAGLDPSL